MAILKELASVMPIVTGIVAVFFGLLAWRFNERSIRRHARQDHIRMILEINRIVIEHPELYCIFPGERDMPRERVQSYALISLFFNMFDAVFDFERHLNIGNLNWRTRADRENFEAWEATIRDFFKEAPEAKHDWHKDRHVYNKAFVEWVDRLIDTATAK
jgi:hypothetical protein